MYGGRKRKHVTGQVNMSSQSVTQPELTTDASLRLENTGGDAANAKWYDISGNGNHGNWTGGLHGRPDNVNVVLGNVAPGPWFWDGISNNPGTGQVSQYVETTTPTTLQKHDVPWTYSAWVARDAADPPPEGDVCYVSTRGRTTTKGWSLRNLNTGLGPFDMDVFNGTGNGALLNVLPTNSDDTWYLHTVTWAPGDPGTLTCYVNGAQYFTGTLTLAQQWTTASTEPDRLGAANYSMWAGYFDTMRVYDRILSPDEMVRDYYAGLPAHTPLWLKKNLISEYLPSGQTPTAWADAHGSNNMTGAVTAPPAFDGNDYYTIGQPADLEFSGAFTVEAWASQEHDSSQGSERLVSLDAVNGSRSFLMTMRDDTGKAEAHLYGTGPDAGNNTVLVSTSTYTNNDWHHVVVVNHGEGKPYQLWVDGILEDESATGGRTMYGYGVADWEIGRSQLATSPDFLEGRCDTVRFYNAPLTPSQIAYNYNAGLPAHS